MDDSLVIVEAVEGEIPGSPDSMIGSSFVVGDYKPQQSVEEKNKGEISEIETDDDDEDAVEAITAGAVPVAGNLCMTTLKLQVLSPKYKNP